MNDFTKDELGTIFLDMNHNILKVGKNNVAPFYLKLRDKVESMIDNYCNHEWRCWDDEHNTRECLKCAEKRTGEINDNQ